MSEVNCSESERSDLTKLLYGDFTPSEKSQRIYNLAIQYEKETEAYDKNICRLINERGIAIPVSAWEKRASSENARRVRNKILASNRDIDPAELKRTINRLNT